MWRVRHWVVGLRAVARHWGLSMPSKFASLPSHVSLLFFGLVYWGFIFWTQLAWSFFIMGRLGRATISLGSPIWSMPSFFCAGAVSLGLWVMV